MLSDRAVFWLLYWSLLAGFVGWGTVGMAALIRWAVSFYRGSRWMMPRAVVWFALLYLPAATVVLAVT